jgi:hypothetical protein
MSSQKVMIVVLVVLALIFLITLGMAGCHSSRRPDPDHAGAVGALKGLQGKRFLQIGDKASTTCGTPNAATLTVTGSCAIFVQKRAFFRKPTRVVLQPVGELHVTVDPNNGPGVENQSVDAGRCVATSVDHHGGSITLTGNTAVSVLRHAC